MPHPHDPATPSRRDRRRLARRTLAAAVLPLIVAPTMASMAAYADPPADEGYSLTSTLSPAAMTSADCAADPACVAAPAPAPGGADNHAALKAAVTAAVANAVPAVVDGNGVVVTPAQPGTVFLTTGVYPISKELKLPPNVNLRGSGIADTTISMITANWQNFNYGYLVRADTSLTSPGSTNLVSDLTVNGNCREGEGTADPEDMPNRPGEVCDFRASGGGNNNAGGGMSAGDRWTVRQIRFTNLEYFKLWVRNVKDVHVIDNRFDNWGDAESGEEDNIGGGGRNENVLIEHNQFDKTIRGNSLDFTNAIGTTVRNNVVYTDPSVAAARGMNEYGNMYLEGVIQATVTDNVLHGAHITLQSNAKYTHSGENKDITNPRDIVVTGNRILDSAYAGILVAYEDYKDANGTYGTVGGWNTFSTDPADHVLRTGGGNIIRDNTIERSRESGILVIGTYGGAKTSADTIVSNTVRNAGFGGSTTYNTGAGFIETSGVGISIGNGDQIFGNSVIDDQAKPTTWFGIHLGGRKAPTTPVNTVLADPAGQIPANTATGIIGSLYRDAAVAPEAPTGLAATSGTLTWNESYALANIPIGGYKVYRDGVAVADLPVGSATVPGNLLSNAQASFETDTAGWTAGTRTTIARNGGAGAIGGASLALTSTGTGQISAYSPKVSATGGTTYTSAASFQAGTTGRRVRAGLAFTDAAGVVTRVGSNNVATVDATSGWMTSSYTAQSPAGAVWVQAFLMVENTVAGEVHLVDRVGLVTGTSTEQWTDPYPVGPATYHVVAYRQSNGELSPAATVQVS